MRDPRYPSAVYVSLVRLLAFALPFCLLPRPIASPLWTTSTLPLLDQFTLSLHLLKEVDHSKYAFDMDHGVYRRVRVLPK
jgi:hypothetical protein